MSPMQTRTAIAAVTAAVMLAGCSSTTTSSPTTSTTNPPTSTTSTTTDPWAAARPAVEKWAQVQAAMPSTMRGTPAEPLVSQTVMAEYEAMMQTIQTKRLRLTGTSRVISITPAEAVAPDTGQGPDPWPSFDVCMATYRRILTPDGQDATTDTEGRPAPKGERRQRSTAVAAPLGPDGAWIVQRVSAGEGPC